MDQLADLPGRVKHHAHSAVPELDRQWPAERFSGSHVLRFDVPAFLWRVHCAHELLSCHHSFATGQHASSFRPVPFRPSSDCQLDDRHQHLDTVQGHRRPLRFAANMVGHDRLRHVGVPARRHRASLRSPQRRSVCSRQRKQRCPVPGLPAHPRECPLRNAKERWQRARPGTFGWTFDASAADNDVGRRTAGRARRGQLAGAGGQGRENGKEAPAGQRVRLHELRGQHTASAEALWQG